MTNIEITYVNGQKEAFKCEKSEYDDNLFIITLIDDDSKREQVLIPLRQIAKITELQYYE